MIMGVLFLNISPTTSTRLTTSSTILGFPCNLMTVVWRWWLSSSLNVVQVTALSPPNGGMKNGADDGHNVSPVPFFAAGISLGVVADVKGRSSWYKDEWVAGLRTGFRAPTMYIFFAPALPVISFGEQLNNETG